MTRRHACIAVLLALAVAVTAPAALGARFRTVTVSRCGILTPPPHVKDYFPKRLGIYITAGHVSCAKGKQLIRRAFTVAGVDIGAGDNMRYPDGWFCGGQMGFYSCWYPYARFPGGPYTKSVEARDCTLRSVGCPRRAKFVIQ